ncbi:hypothetical protein KDU71_05135 [Carboxylicivirga sediminis]|uniref:Uncharacterized protein n=1 Tax=Carboxylicivirga sediminis TaxID=2006564 RepID=A0A941F142_9BACT|nr:hypothetical protein [Carboxylicivirga sediminis]MBR8534936.1 hypothetical protein [Carboxylicivirga sediminis]
MTVKGSSIIEVVVAIFIISMSIALSGVLFNTVFSSSDRLLKQRAWYDTNHLVNEVITTKNTEPLILEKQLYTVSKQTQLMDEAKGLWLIQINATQGEDKLLASRRLYIEIPVNED